MSSRYLAFDLETAKILPEDAGELLAHRPLGIACAAAVASDSGDASTWFGGRPGAPAARMTREEAGGLVRDLSARARDGYTLLTWNGLSFDFNVLAEESGLPEECGRLALAHVDMMFQVVCQLGHRVSLQKAAEGLGLPGKPAGIMGANAPALWAEGRHEEVLRYNLQDVRTALGVAQTSERLGELRWITRKGDTGRMPLPEGWRDVRRARELPAPDTSWMRQPPSRESFLSWIPGAVAVGSPPAPEESA